MEISIECKFLQYSSSECFCWTNNNLSIGGTNAANSFRIIGGGLIYMIAVWDVELVEIRVSLSDKEAGFEVGDTLKKAAKG